MPGGLPKGHKNTIVFIRLPTKSQCDTRPFYSEDRAQSKTHARQVQKIIGSVSIPLMGRLIHPAGSQFNLAKQIKPMEMAP